MRSANFEKIVGLHIIIEGGFVDNPLDPGGETNFGISKQFNPDVDVANLTPELAKNYYYDRYWKVMGLDNIIDESVCAEMFDIGAGPNGPKAAAMILQGALTLLKQDVGAIDGIIGPRTIKSANEYPNKIDLVKMLNRLQFTHLLVGGGNVEEIIQMAKDRLPQLQMFMKGWLKRV